MTRGKHRVNATIFIFKEIHTKFKVSKRGVFEPKNEKKKKKKEKKGVFLKQKKKKKKK